MSCLYTWVCVHPACITQVNTKCPRAGGVQHTGTLSPCHSVCHSCHRAASSADPRHAEVRALLPVVLSPALQCGGGLSSRAARECRTSSCCCWVLGRCPPRVSAGGTAGECWACRALCAISQPQPSVADTVGPCCGSHPAAPAAQPPCSAPSAEPACADSVGSKQWLRCTQGWGVCLP